ncbi:MAG TPA: stage III sporulation protein AD [Clostridiales bacterium]|nr:MAG: stage III sporulation protein AD [Clostridiales bacterium GWD2_32_19]HCC06724.1 stage III sporulation protein AD [Clostridiales bacterium]
MEITQIIVICFIGVVMISILGKDNKEYGTYIRIVIGVIVFAAIFMKLASIAEMFMNIINKTNLSSTYIEVILKIIGIAYLSEFGSQICKDANEASFATKIEFTGKILIMVIAMPIMTAILDEVSNFFV